MYCKCCIYVLTCYCTPPLLKYTISSILLIYLDLYTHLHFNHNIPSPEPKLWSLIICCNVLYLNAYNHPHTHTHKHLHEAAVWYWKIHIILVSDEGVNILNQQQRLNSVIYSQCKSTWKETKLYSIWLNKPLISMLCVWMFNCYKIHV